MTRGEAIEWLVKGHLDAQDEFHFNDEAKKLHNTEFNEALKALGVEQHAIDFARQNLTETE